MKRSVLICCFLLGTIASSRSIDPDADDGDSDTDTFVDNEYDEESEFATDTPVTTFPPSNIGTNSLRLVNVLYRHGDRSPTHSYKNDIYQESDWPQGYGQLSKKGKKQEYELGKFLKERYVDSGFLAPIYQRDEIYVRSTAYDRTLMSANCVLAALFPPIDETQTWNDDIPWQPIPIHTVPVEEDSLLVMNTSCPAFNEAQNEFLQQSPVMNETMAANADLYVYISDNSGEPNTWYGIQNVLDPIYCQSVSDGYNLPDWVYPQIMNSINELSDIYAGSLISPQYAYLRGGPLVSEMMQHMINTSINDTLPSKMFMYSAHDTTVVHFLITLGVYNYRKPPYSACVMVELHELQPGDFQVLILYRNNTEEDPYPLKLPSCDIYCPLKQFIDIMQPSVPTDFKAACSLPNPERNRFSAFVSSIEMPEIVAIILGCVLTIVLMVLVIVTVKKKCSKAVHEYVPVPIEMDECVG
ncbi:mitochondrial acyl carrier protein [Mactra antiquata]